MTNPLDATQAFPTVDLIINGEVPVASPVADALVGPRLVGTETAGNIDAVLEGGPVTLPAELRSHRVSPVAHKIKVRHYGGYEHFERDPSEVSGDAAAVFRWTGRTRMAE